MKLLESITGGGSHVESDVEPVEIDVGEDIKYCEGDGTHILVDFPSSDESSSNHQQVSTYGMYRDHFALPTIFDPSSYYSLQDKVTPITWTYLQNTLASIGLYKLSYGFMGMGAELGGKLKQLGPLKVEYEKENRDRVNMIGSYDLAYDKDGLMKWAGDHEVQYTSKNRILRIGSMTMKYGIMKRLNKIGSYALEYGYFGKLYGIHMYGGPLTDEILLFIYLAIRHVLSEEQAQRDRTRKLKQAAVVISEP